MAKRSNELTFGADRAKVRIFYAELEGGNESVQEALRTMATAVSRPVRPTYDQVGLLKPAVLPQEAVLDETSDLFPETLEPDSAVSNDASNLPRRTRGTGPRKDRNAGLELVLDLNFRPTGQPILKDFFAEKQPSNDIEAVLVFVYYLEKKAKLEKVGASHIMTAFKEVGKPIPADIRQAFRNIKKSKGWLKFADVDDVKTTTQGENFVEHEMGGSK